MIGQIQSTTYLVFTVIVMAKSLMVFLLNQNSHIYYRFMAI